MIRYRRCIRDRTRMATASTTGSYFSTDSPLCGTEKSRVLDNFDCLGSREEFDRVLKVYFQVDFRKVKVNEMCVSVLKREIELQELKKRVKEKNSEVLKDEASRSLDLLRFEEEIVEEEASVNDWENSIKVIESQICSDRNSIEDIRSSCKVLIKDSLEKKKIIESLVRLEEAKVALKSEISLLKKHKQDLLSQYRSIEHKLSSTRALSQTHFSKKTETRSKEKSSQDLENSIKTCKNTLSNLKQALAAQQEKNLSTLSQKKTLETRLDEITSQNLARSQWHKELSLNISSKLALNRVVHSKVETRLAQIKSSKSYVESILADLDQKEAQLEQAELIQNKSERVFRKDLKSIMKSLKPK